MWIDIDVFQLLQQGSVGELSQKPCCNQKTHSRYLDPTQVVYAIGQLHLAEHQLVSQSESTASSAFSGKRATIQYKPVKIFFWQQQRACTLQTVVAHKLAERVRANLLFQVLYIVIYLLYWGAFIMQLNRDIFLWTVCECVYKARQDWELKTKQELDLCIIICFDPPKFQSIAMHDLI